eukprot:TRINITY_DN4442_c0_g1_i1.p1 TRINITY_DN4442_c0_g1~~TRINITY_DN4442_c0_g1_i1.p1  ORF type:complete len:170 (+),score=37.92 TRINITY_DN4442_c0_g1_i1:272-781(+)
MADMSSTESPQLRCSLRSQTRALQANCCYERIAEETARRKKKAPRSRKLDWEQQEALWTSRQERLRPFQRVEVQYIAPGGRKVKAFGTLVRGWRTNSNHCEVPHSKAPSPSIQSQEVRRAKHASAEKPWLAEVELANNDDDYAIVVVNGIEKVLPREWVKPLPEDSSFF